jgi:hypothetical protein
VIGGHTSDLNEVFVCTELASKGSFSIPAYVVAGLRRKNEKNATIFIGAHPLSRSVNVPGVDAAYALDGSFDSTPVTFRIPSPPIL